MSIEAENEAFETLTAGVVIDVTCEFHNHGGCVEQAQWRMDLWCPECGQEDLILICEDAWRHLIQHKNSEEMPCLSCGEVSLAFTMVDSLRKW